MRINAFLAYVVKRTKIQRHHQSRCMLRFFPVCLLVITSLILFPSCDSAQDESINRIKTRGQIILAMGRDFPPFYYFNDKNELVGFEVDVARELAERLGVGLKLVNVEWTAIIDGLLADRYDGILASMAVTEERSERVAFSIPYYYSVSQLFVRRDALFKNPFELKDRIVGVSAGTTYEKDARERLTATIKYYSSAKESLTELNQGALEGVITDRVVGLYIMNVKNYVIKPLGAPLHSEKIAAAFRKQDKTLLKKVDEIMEDMQQDGTLNQLIKKVAGQEYELF